MSETNNPENRNEKEEVQASENFDEKEVDEMIDETEKQSLNELATLKEADNEANEKIIDDAQADIRKIFADLKLWIRQNSDPEAIRANLENAKEQTIEVLSNARAKAIEVSESPEFRQTLEAGKDFLKGTGMLIGEGFKELKGALCQNPSIKKCSTGPTSRSTGCVPMTISGTQSARCMKRPASSTTRCLKGSINSSNRKPNRQLRKKSKQSPRTSRKITNKGDH